jgi:putative PIN family toxin of toxin-antitoxin system
MRMAFRHEIGLVVSETSLAELREKAVHKPYLADRLASEDVQGLEATLRDIATIVPAAAEPQPGRTRDPKDDYLLAPEILDLVDHIVTGDKDLLDLQDVRDDLILSSAAFLQVLDVGREPDHEDRDVPIRPDT